MSDRFFCVELRQPNHLGTSQQGTIYRHEQTVDVIDRQHVQQTVSRVEATEIVGLQAEVARLERTIIEQAVELGVLRGKSGWG